MFSFNSFPVSKSSYCLKLEELISLLRWVCEWMEGDKQKIKDKAWEGSSLIRKFFKKCNKFIPSIMWVILTLRQYHMAYFWVYSWDTLLCLSLCYRSMQGSIVLRDSVQFSSVAQSCPTLWDPMDCSTPGLPVHHQLPEFTQTHVHWVGDAIQLSRPLSSTSPPVFSLSQHQGLFKWISSSLQMAKVLEFQLQHQSFQWIFRTDFL